MYRLYRLGWAGFALLVTTTVVCFGIAAWNIDGAAGGTDARFFGLGFLGLVTGLGALLGMGIWSDRRPSEPLPWRERRELRRERARIRLDKAIEDLEREAGL